MEEVCIKIGGVLSAVVGIGHCFFYRMFGWKQEFEKITLLTSQVLYTIHLFVIPLLFFFAYVSVMHTKELAGASRKSDDCVFFCILALPRDLADLLL